MSGQQLIDMADLSDGHAYLRCRLPRWSNPDAYVRLSVLADGGRRHLGPWAHLYDRRTQEAIGEPTPQAFLTLHGASSFLTDDYDVWTGPLDPADGESRR